MATFANNGSSRFAEISHEEIDELKENAVPNTTKSATKFGVKVFKEWFLQQNEFTQDFETMGCNQMNKCLSKFYVSARKKDGSCYKRTSLMSIRAALDRHLRSPPYNNKYSICDNTLFNEANKTLNSFLKHLSSTGKIAGTVHKKTLTAETVKKLYEANELGSAETTNPRVLMQTVWFYISLYFGRRGRENQSYMKKSMLRLVVTAEGQEYFELNKDQPGTILSSKNHTGGLDGTEDHSDGKIFAQANSARCPVQTIKTYLSHLNDEIENLFQRPKTSPKFDPEQDDVWYEKKPIGHNTLENMLRCMTQKAGILPYLTNHSLRATTVTILSSKNVETRNIRAVTGHRSDNSIQSYCDRPTLDQYKHMSSVLSTFIGNEPEENSTANPTDIVQATTSSAPVQVEHDGIPIDRNAVQFLQSNGMNPGAILPSGTFHECSFTFNIKLNNNN